MRSASPRRYFERPLLLVEQPEAVERQLQLRQIVHQGQEIGEEDIRDDGGLHLDVRKADEAGRFEGHG